mgnify:CR=1 FL=1
MQAAFIMHARTKYNDFMQGNFLVKPENFPNEEIVKVYEHVGNETRYFDIAPSEGIKITFCDKKFIVLGVSIKIAELYKLCGRETKYSRVDNDNGRSNNHAFMGFVFKREDIEEIHEEFDITYKLLLEHYERYISDIWEKPFSIEGIKPIFSRYERISLTKTADTSKIAVSVTHEMFKKSGLSSPENEQEPDENENKLNTRIIAVIIVIALVAALLGLKPLKNFIQQFLLSWLRVN